MSGSLSIGRIAGIRIEVNYSWLIIFVLIIAALQRRFVGREES